MKKDNVLIIDALNFFTRHYVVNPSMSEQGHPIGGMVGFLKGIRLLCEKLLPSKVIVVWEGGGSPRRRAIYPEYKSGRKPQKLNRYYEHIPDTDRNRDYQIALTIEALNHVAAQQIYISDCEADDIISYISRYLLKDQEITVVSSDKDLYQLIDDRVAQYSPGQKKIIHAQDVYEKFGVYPCNMTVTRCFVGDSSDDLKGVKGAGFKTMVKRFPSLSGKEEVLLEDVLQEGIQKSEGSNLKIYQNIREGADIVRRNWKLMHLDINNLSGNQIKKINDSVEMFEPSQDKMALMRFLIREGVKTFDVDTFFMSMKACLT